MSVKIKFSMRERMRFSALLVIIKDNTVYSTQKEVLGPLAGAHAELSRGAEKLWHRTVFFSDGRVYDSGGLLPVAVAGARRQVAEFNMAAEAAAASG